MSNKYVNDFTPVVKTYYKELKKYSPISREEERKLMKKAKNKDEIAKNKLLSSNLRFVFDVAKKYKGCGLPLEDLISEGNMGLMYAFDKFDEKKDVRFISYAVWWINYYIKDFIAKGNAKAEHEVYDDDLQNPVINKNDGESSEMDDTANSNESEIEESEINEENLEMIKKLLSRLDLRERKIIECYFGLNNKKPMTLKECGGALGLSQERIRQVKEKTLLKLRSEMLLLSQ